MNIKCPACGFENEEDANFCSNCNDPLVTPKISINKENSYIKKEISNNTENTNIKRIKRIIKKERLWMNWKQKAILAIFIPVLLFLVTFTIAYYISVDVVITPGYMDNITELFKRAEAEGYDYQPPPAITRRYYDPYDWEKTWYVWLLFLAFCCFFEYKLFEDKEIISNKKNKELR
ncbi:hypothetical protein KJ599_06680 [bacterium]|nr:hypothetical protein [bacterium]